MGFSNLTTLRNQQGKNEPSDNSGSDLYDDFSNRHSGVSPFFLRIFNMSFCVLCILPSIPQVHTRAKAKIMYNVMFPPTVEC